MTLDRNRDEQAIWIGICKTCAEDTAGAGQTAVDAGDTGSVGEKGSPVTQPEGLRQQGGRAPRSVAKSTRRSDVVRSRRPSWAAPIAPADKSSPCHPNSRAGPSCCRPKRASKPARPAGLLCARRQRREKKTKETTQQAAISEPEEGLYSGRCPSTIGSRRQGEMKCWSS